jgi:hypothetical protein
MATGKKAKLHSSDPLQLLTQNNYLFRGLEEEWLSKYLPPDTLTVEKLFSNRAVYTAFLPDEFLDVLYVVVEGGPIILCSNPLDRIIALTYPGGCFGMRSLPFSHGLASRAFPSLVEAYKTTHVIKIPLEALKNLYQDSPGICDRYNVLFELREKFQYHLLNCSTHPPQAVASLLRALIYQEKKLGTQPNDQGVYLFDLPLEVIARTCQLNQRTIEQVLKGMQKVGLIEGAKPSDSSKDLIRVVNPDGLKEVYSTTRDKVNWWPVH